MPKRLPSDVLQFLRDNPEEVRKLQDHIKAVESNKKWREELAEKRKNAKIVPCNTYGCTNPKNEFDVMCESCEADYREDPDAYK